ncbi:MAG TPA: class I SAM-dependent methyltransferase [Thermoanaerobaculia bacterium]|nr:class I SAM-dependent methyltransferase [Thermoanaerobaculia bacterium]
MNVYSLIRRMPRPMIEAAYRALEAADAVPNAVRNLRRSPNEMPLPPMRLRARVGSRGAGAFLQAGKSCADALRNAARTHLQIEIENAGRVLDFGCGCGRTLRHFSPAPIEGCDVDAPAIAWMQRSAGAERFAANRFDPPLPWHDATFDLVYSVSIFTHLDETSQRDWLREIARVVKPGGSALLTVQSEHALSMFLSDAIYSTASMKRRLTARGSLDRHGGFLFEPYEVDTTSMFPGVTKAYGLAFHSRAYIERVWSEWFDVRGIDVGSVDRLQDVVTLKRR